MLFLVSKYQIEDKSYLLDVEGLRKILDRKRGNIGLEKYINSLPEELDPPKGRTVSDWLNNKHEPRDVNQVLCLMEAISEDWKLILIPEDEVMGPEFEEKRLKARAIELNEKRKMINLDLFFIQAYLYYFGNYNVSYIEMKKALSGRLIATDKFLDDVETVLKICQEEPSELSTFKDKFCWNDYRDRLLRNRYKSVFPGYGFVAKVLRYKFEKRGRLLETEKRA